MPTDEKIKSFCFADDTAYVFRGRDIKECKKQMTIFFKKIQEWAKSNRVEISFQKCQVVNFHRGMDKARFDFSEMNIGYMDESNSVKCFPCVNYYDYLGIRLDKHLTFKDHIQKIADEVKLRSQFVKRIGKTMQLPRAKLDLLYNGYVRGFINYGCRVYGSASSRFLEKLEVADRCGIRAVCGALSRTKNSDLMRCSGYESVKKQIDSLAVRNLFRVVMKEGLKDLRDWFQKCTYGRVSSPLGWAMNLAWTKFGITRLDLLRNGRSIWLTKKQELRNYSNPKKPPWTRLNSYWKERMLFRIRVGVLPTKAWACLTHQADSDICRHCKHEVEDLDHLFGKCESLQYSELEGLGFRV